MTSIPAKARLLTVVVILSNVAGNLLLGKGMKSSSLTLAAFGVALLILWMLSRMTLMSWADLSYILPVTSIGYVLSALAAQMFLGEHLSPFRWTGTLFITAGMIVVSSTPPKT